MQKHFRLFSFCFVLYLFHITITGIHCVNASGGYHQNNVTSKLFVFGDLYADTGKWNKEACSWKEPHGLTFPGKPTGRLSDGRVSTDCIASFLGIESPVPFTWRKTANKSSLQSGMNFAFGGTGVFDTFVDAPNMTVQIDFFQQLLEPKVYTNQDLNSSLALASVAGNDYPAYLCKDGNLQMAVKRLNNKSTAGDRVFHFLDIYSAFTSTLKKGTHEGSSELEDRLEPCCVGVTSEYSCGDEVGSGRRKYVVSGNQESSIFWDMVHPTQNGWESALSTLKSSLQQLVIH